MRPLALCLALVWGSAGPAVAGPVDEAIAEGDAHYRHRAEGAQGAVAERGPIEAAVAAYRRALGSEPHRLEATYKLLRALFFRATFCGASREERKALFEESRRLGQDAVDRLEKAVASERDAARLAALAERPHAADVYFWTAVCWGQWALLRGTLAAARAGAASAIRDLALRLLALDPRMEQGGADRLLGRLHHQAPKIPLFTGWISKTKALVHLRRALELGPHNTVNQVFLAEAILDIDPARKDEARRLLTQCAFAEPRPEYLVEDTYYAAEAKALLAGLR